MMIVKLVKRFVEKVKRDIKKEVNDWKGAVSMLRTRLVEADFVISPNRVEPKELSEKDTELFREIVMNGVNAGDSVHKIAFKKQVTNLTFTDSVGHECTWKANGHLTKAEIIDWLMDMGDSLYPKYVSVSFTTHRNEEILFRIEYLELPTIMTEEGEEISEVFLIDEDLDNWDKLIRDNVIHTESYITMSVRGSKYLVDEFMEKQMNTA